MAGDDKQEPEELEVEAFMDRYSSSEEAPGDSDRRKWYRARYEFIREAAKRIQLEREEIERTGGKQKEQMLNSIRQAFADNYRSRKAIVTALRMLGEKVEDTLVPNSAT